MTTKIPAILGLLGLAALLPAQQEKNPPAAARQNPARALAALEKPLRASPNDPKLWARKGRLLYALSQEARRQGLGGGLFLALQALRKAADLGSRDPETYLLLCKVLRETGRASEGLNAARKALELSPKDSKTRGRALLALGAALCGRLPSLPEGPQRKASAREALRILREASTLVPGKPETWIYLSNARAWMGDLKGELETLKQGLTRLPRSQGLHLYLQNRLFALKLFDEARGLLSWMVKEDPSNAVARWYLGRAWMARAEAFREAGKPGLAMEAYDRTVKAYREALGLNPSFEKSCRQSIAMALVGKGWLLVEKGDAPRARKVLGEAYRTWPGVFDKRDRFGVSYISAMETLGMRLLGGRMGFSPGALVSGQKNSRVEGLLQAADLYAELIRRHPDRGDRLGFWYNNIGLAMRDAGTALAGGRRRSGGGIPPKARQAWEASYRAYLKAVEYCPDDPRILNDCALVQVYHLGTKIDEAEKMLIRARDLGLSMIDSERGSWTEERRKFLEEAVGDAWSNLGLLYQRYRNDPEKARTCREEANKYYPRNQRSRRDAAGRRGGRPPSRPPFASMPPGRREKAFDSMIARFRRFADRLRQAGKTQRAKRLAEWIGRLEELASAGKWADVDKALAGRGSRRRGR